MPALLQSTNGGFVRSAAVGLSLPAQGLTGRRGDLAERARLHFKAVAYWERHDTITPRQCGSNSGPVKMLAAFQSAGVDLVSFPQLGVLFEKIGPPRQRLRGGKYEEPQGNVLGIH